MWQAGHDWCLYSNLRWSVSFFVYSRTSPTSLFIWCCDIYICISWLLIRLVCYFMTTMMQYFSFFYWTCHMVCPTRFFPCMWRVRIGHVSDMDIVSQLVCPCFLGWSCNEERWKNSLVETVEYVLECNSYVYHPKEVLLRLWTPKSNIQVFFKENDFFFFQFSNGVTANGARRRHLVVWWELLLSNNVALI